MQARANIVKNTVSLAVFIMQAIGLFQVNYYKSENWKVI
jgi:hypothetical protein